MTSMTLKILSTTAVLAGLAMQPAQAYGPRDSMSYTHPTAMPAKVRCSQGLQGFASNNPRLQGPQQVCRSRSRDRDASLRLDHSGPRPRAVAVPGPGRVASR